MFYKKILSALLVLSLVMTTLTGCKKEEVSNETGKMNNTSSVMGRYMEEEAKLPEGMDASSIVEIIRGQQDNLEIYTQESNNYYCYSLKQDGSFEKTEQPWLLAGSSEEESRQRIYIFYGEDNNLYAGYQAYTSDSGYSKVLKAKDDRQSADILELSYLQKVVNQVGSLTFYPSITDVRVLKNGNIVIADENTDELHILDGKSGEEQSTLPVYVDNSSRSNGQGVPFFVKDNNIITINAVGNKITVYNTETEKTDREIEVDHYSGNLIYDMDLDGTIYVCDSSGISKISPEGSLWENIVDGSLCSLNMPSIALNHFVQFGIENEKPAFYCYVMDSSKGTGKLLKYVYDSTIPSVPTKELTIYSLNENSTISQAIAEYQRTNSDVKITYNVAISGDKSATVEDYVKALNTELLAGKGADLIVMDSLPMDSYIEKGVLTDISPLYQAMIEKGQLSKEMLGAYEKNQKVYGIPSRFTIPLLYGTKEAVEAGNSLQSLSEYMRSQSDKEILYPLTSDELTMLLLTYYYNEVITPDKAINQEALMNLLDIVKITSENAQKENNYNDNWHESLSGVGEIANKMGGSSAGYLSLQKIKLGVNNLDSVLAMMIPFSVVDENQYGYGLMNQSYLPLGTIGINAASNNKELAQEFIECLLSESVQSVKLYDGFPVNSNSLKDWFEEQNDDIAIGSSSDEGIEIHAYWPKKEYRDEVYQEVSLLSTPIVANQILIEKITEATKKYYSGEASKDEIMNLVQSSISTYLSE